MSQKNCLSGQQSRGKVIDESRVDEKRLVQKMEEIQWGTSLTDLKVIYPLVHLPTREGIPTPPDIHRSQGQVKNMDCPGRSDVADTVGNAGVWGCWVGENQSS